MKIFLFLLLLATPAFSQNAYDGFLVNFGDDSTTAVKKMEFVHYEMDTTQSTGGRIFGKGNGNEVTMFFTKNTGVYKSVVLLYNATPASFTIDDLIVRIAPKIGFNAKKFKNGYKWILKSSNEHPVEVTAFKVADGFEVIETDLTLEKEAKKK